MAAPYDGRKVANLLLDRFDSVKWGISNKKINKVLFFVHGVGLARLSYPLIRNHFEAWDHGPVVSVVYHSFKQFDFKPICLRAAAFNYVSNKEEVLMYTELDPRDREFIVKVAEYYMQRTADDLESMTHEVDAPWSIIRAIPPGERGLRNRIPDDLIRRYFVERLGAPRSVN